MTNLEYSGELTKDISIIKKTSTKRQAVICGFDIAYVLILISYLIFVIARLVNGLGSVPNLSIYVNFLITIRCSLYIKNTSNLSKATDARHRIYNLINEIFDIKNQGNNISCTLNVYDFENSIIEEEKMRDKEYDENNKMRSDTDTIINYIYLLDDEDRINVLREIKKKIKNAGFDKIVETKLELLDPEDIPEVLPVKQVLKLKK